MHWSRSSSGGLPWVVSLVCAALTVAAFPAGAPCDSPRDRTFESPPLSDGAGGSIVCWTESPDDAPSTLRAQRYGPASGPARWSAPTVVATAGYGNDFQPSMATDGEGGALIAWVARDEHDIARIHVLRLDSSGLAEWSKGAVVACPTGGEQRYPSVLSDESGGAYVAWQDARRETGEDVFLQHLTAAGGIDSAWPPGGLLLTTARGLHVSPRTARLGEGLIVAWLDRAKPAEVRPYAQRVLANGSRDPSWPEGGALLSHSPAEDLTLIRHGDGALSAAWRDGNTFESRTLALTDRAPVLESAGGTWPPGGPSSQWVTAFFAPRPNPSKDAVDLQFSLATRQAAQLTIFDLAGRRVAVPLRGTFDAGVHHLVWNRRASRDEAVRDGMYFVRLDTDHLHVTRRFALVH